MPGFTPPQTPANRKYDYGALLRLAKAQGLSDSDAATMAAIGLAESSGDPGAKNKQSTATGLWQIMWSVWKDDPDMKAIGVTDRDSLADPGRNAKAMAIVLRKQGFKAWEVYNTGAYKSRMPVIQGGIGDVAKNIAGDWVAGITGYVNRAGQVVGVSLLAALLIIVGIVILVASSRTVRNVAGAVAPAGKAVKAVKKVAGK